MHWVIVPVPPDTLCSSRFRGVSLFTLDVPVSTHGPYSSNFLAGVVRDLAVGGSIALLALVLVGLGRGDAEPLSLPAQTTTIPTSTTEAGALGGDHGEVGYLGRQELVGEVALQSGEPRPDELARPRSPGDRP